VGVVLVAVVGAACTGGSVTTTDLESAEAKWDAREPAGYAIYLNGQIGDEYVSVASAVSGDRSASITGQPDDEYDVSGLFDLVRSALASGVDVTASFDSDLGYPTRIRMDASGDDPSVDLVTAAFGVFDLPIGCDSPEGSPTDLRSEPLAWVSNDDTYIRRTDAVGCLVRIDVIDYFYGPLGCGWESAEYFTIGTPLGTSIADDQTRLDSRRTYIWDPQDVITPDDPPRDRTIPVEDLPDTAIDTGYRLDTAELWTDTADDRHIYRAADGHADQFVLDADHQLLCA
jgi:hypothetical protein